MGAPLKPANECLPGEISQFKLLILPIISLLQMVKLEETRAAYVS